MFGMKGFRARCLWPHLPVLLMIIPFLGTFYHTRGLQGREPKAFHLSEPTDHLPSLFCLSSSSLAWQDPPSREVPFFSCVFCPLLLWICLQASSFSLLKVTLVNTRILEKNYPKHLRTICVLPWATKCRSDSLIKSEKARGKCWEKTLLSHRAISYSMSLRFLPGRIDFQTAWHSFSLLVISPPDIYSSSCSVEPMFQLNQTS